MHADRQGNLAAVAVMFEEGAKMAKAWVKRPDDAGEKHKIAGGIDAEALMPDVSTIGLTAPCPHRPATKGFSGLS